ncbi:MAG TPA: D-alanyl-D-alanine carboxypeptidase/D-alanyl-D-alanine-endopeptidase [Candidatus Acidoferrales bacterium]|nr:D-alanyl-D-alanine carboxypeptidase/D-alanyl-D-alanine-endopeptidase [Candidatus Acidoferrales bacterium]
MLAAACAIVAIAALAWQRFAAPRAPAPAPPLPLARFVPTPPPARWTRDQTARLRAALADAFAPAIDGAGGWSLDVIARDGTTIYANRADHAVAPASVQKLIVAATALDALGPDFRYDTILAARQPVSAGGVLTGNLWLIGSGDPSLRYLDLRSGVQTLARSGLRRIDGGVAIDASALRGPETNPNWDPDDLSEDYAAPTSAVSLDEDTVEFDVTGTTAGAPAAVAVQPPSAAVSVTGTVATSDGTDDVDVAQSGTPNDFIVSGSVPPGVREQFYLPVHGLPEYAGAVVQRMLADRGITTTLPPSVSKAPLDTISLWMHRSPALRVLEAFMLVHSDNHYAEQLLRTVGGEASGAPDDAGGILAERRFLSERGIPAPGLRLLDGSGLAPGNRVAAVTLATLLSDAELRGGASSLYLLLPQGGRQGTLRHYDFTTALGRVRAKSGHIGGVASLAGYVNTVHHGRITFAFSINGSDGDPDAAIVRAVDRLATF